VPGLVRAQTGWRSQPPPPVGIRRSGGPRSPHYSSPLVRSTEEERVSPNIGRNAIPLVFGVEGGGGSTEVAGVPWSWAGSQLTGV
jgi:hypothetical protein